MRQLFEPAGDQVGGEQGIPPFKQIYQGPARFVETVRQHFRWAVQSQITARHSMGLAAHLWSHRLSLWPRPHRRDPPNANAPGDGATPGALRGTTPLQRSLVSSTLWPW